jgi:hypothetical protein
MARTKKIDPEEQQKRMIETAIRDNEKRIELGLLRMPPRHRRFKVGDRVQYGAHRETYVREVYKDGMYYLIECIAVKRERDQPPHNEKQIQEWHQLFPFETKDTEFRQEEKYYIRQSNSGIGSLLHMTHRAGVDFDVEYQREHVWTLADKVALIDSIFNNIDIGKFVFIQRDYSSDIFYEILDGKQRLSALRDFYEDRFKYRGYYFSELSRTDKNKFDNHSVTMGYLENPDKRAIFESFIKLNTCGKPMAKRHIDHVQKLLDELED